MGKSVLTGVFFSLGGTDLSAYTAKAEYKRAAEAKETTTYGSGGSQEFLGGLKSGSIDWEFLQDFAAAALDSIIDPLVGTVVAFEIRPTQAAVGTSNPKRTGSVLVTEWNALSGKVGDEARVSGSWPTTGVVTRGVV